MGHWYAVHTHQRAEERALVHLKHQGFTGYLPRYLAQRSHARRRDWVRRPLFPGYLFLSLDLQRDRWRSVDSTVGVRGLVSAGDGPLAVPVGVVEEIRAREDQTGMVVLGADHTFHRDQPVRIVDGPFAEMEGLFQRYSGEERVLILLDLLSRPVKVEVSRRSVTSATQI